MSTVLETTWKEAIALGDKQGFERGDKHGFDQGSAQMVLNVMRKYNWSLDQAIDFLGVPESQRAKYASLIRKLQKR